MKTAFYHMAVWNVQEAGDIIQEIIQENDSKGSKTKVKPISVAEKVRSKAAKLRRDERMGTTRGGVNEMGEEEEEMMQQRDQFERA